MPTYMYYVYILFSVKDGKLYIGSTPHLKARLSKHHSGYVPSTKHRRPLRLIYYECYLTGRDAKRREEFLKGGKGHHELKIQIPETLGKVGYPFRY